MFSFYLEELLLVEFDFKNILCLFLAPTDEPTQDPTEDPTEAPEETETVYYRQAEACPEEGRLESAEECKLAAESQIRHPIYKDDMPRTSRTAPQGCTYNSKCDLNTGTACAIFFSAVANDDTDGSDHLCKREESLRYTYQRVAAAKCPAGLEIVDEAECLEAARISMPTPVIKNERTQASTSGPRGCHTKTSCNDDTGANCRVFMGSVDNDNADLELTPICKRQLPPVEYTYVRGEEGVDCPEGMAVLLEDECKRAAEIVLKRPNFRNDDVVLSKAGFKGCMLKSTCDDFVGSNCNVLFGTRSDNEDKSGYQPICLAELEPFSCEVGPDSGCESCDMGKCICRESEGYYNVDGECMKYDLGPVGGQCGEGDDEGVPLKDSEECVMALRFFRERDDMRAQAVNRLAEKVRTQNSKTTPKGCYTSSQCNVSTGQKCAMVYNSNGTGAGKDGKTPVCNYGK